MINVHFTSDQHRAGQIEATMTREFYMSNIKHKLENGQRCIQRINVISPSGAQKVFSLVGEHGSGLRYKCDNLKLNLLNP